MKRVSEIREYVLRWLQARARQRGMNVDIDYHSDYFALGVVDSMGVVELLLAFEKHFGIRFRETDYQRREFATVEGIAAIIATHIDQGRDT